LFVNPLWPTGMRHAAARVLASLAAGVALGHAVQVPWWLAVAVAMLGVAVMRVSRGLALYAAVLATGVLYVGARAHREVDARVYQVREFRAVVLQEPSDFDGSRMVVGLERPLQGQVTVWLRDPAGQFRYGDVVAVRASVNPPDYPRNPGLADQNELAFRRGLVGTSSPRAGQVAVVARGRGSYWMRLVVVPLRRYIRATFARLLPDAEAALMNGLLLGGSVGLPRDVKSAFSDAGIIHILAVSGMNVAIVVGVVWLLLSVVLVRGWWRFWVSLGAVFLYVSLSGWSAAPVRAGLMAMMWLLGMQLQRRVTPLATLSSAGILLLLIDPLSLFEVGAQLSFAATGGILLAMRWLARIEAGPGVGVWLKRMVWLPAGASIAATTATAPLLLHHFFRAQPLAFLSTGLVAPLVGLAMPLGLLVLVAQAVWPALAATLAQSLWLVLWLLLKLGLWLGRLDWAIWEPGRLSWPWVFWLYALALLVPAWQRRWARRLLLGLLAASIGFGLWSCALRRPVTEAAFLDPDQGDAIVLTDSLGRHVVFDAGIDGSGVLRDFLRSRGIHRIAAAVVTHPDRDHFGGLLDLGERVRVERLLVPTQTCRDTACDRLLARLRARGTEVNVVGAGDSLTGFGFSVRFVAPGRTDVRMYEAGLLPTNGISLVARVEHAGFTMLLTGDADGEWWRDGGSADLLKSPHHGSRRGNPDSLFVMLQPRHVVVMGRYPTPAGLEQRFEGTGVDCINTRRDGGFVIRLGRGEPRFTRLKSGLTAGPGP
jgi:competence protein ComEC